MKIVNCYLFFVFLTLFYIDLIYYLALFNYAETRMDKQILKQKHNPDSFSRETVLLGTCETLQN